MRLEEGVRFSGSLDPNWGARDGVYAVKLKLIAQVNWRNVGMTGYQIGRKMYKFEINFKNKSN